MTNNEWKQILHYNDGKNGSLWTRIADTIIENATLIKVSDTPEGYCPKFVLTVKSLYKCLDDLEKLVE